LNFIKILKPLKGRLAGIADFGGLGISPDGFGSESDSKGRKRMPATFRE
jgi:hypothetical protein